MTLSLTARASIFSFLLVLLHYLLLFQRRVEVEAHLRKTQGWPDQRLRAAVVTMADPTFQHCALQLLQSTRDQDWRQPIILLAVDYEDFGSDVTEQFEALGVIVIHTNPIFDVWLQRGVENIDIFRSLQSTKFRKMELFLNPILRAYERLIFMDADGIVDASLEPLLTIPFPENTTLMMRQNDISLGKKGFWGNEIAVEMLSDKQLELLSQRFPNRAKTGGSCWFIVDVKKLHSPSRVASKSIELLCHLRAGFRFNDQTLISLLFYDSISLFPWCVWDEVPILNDPKHLSDYCSKNKHLQRWLNGKLKFIYRHMSVEEKRQCSAPHLRKMKKAQYVESRRDERKDTKSIVNSKFLDEEIENRNCMEAWEQWKSRLPTE